MNKFKIEKVQWVDHFSSSGWQDYPDTPPPDYLATTIGFVVFEDKRYVVLAQTVAEHSCAEMMHILKTDIKSRKKING